MQGTSSAIIAVFIKNDCLAEAQSEYRALRAAGQWPDLYALNALLNAYANRFRWAGWWLVCCVDGRLAVAAQALLCTAGAALQAARCVRRRGRCIATTCC